VKVDPVFRCVLLSYWKVSLGRLCDVSLRDAVAGRRSGRPRTCLSGGDTAAGVSSPNRLQRRNALRRHRSITYTIEFLGGLFDEHSVRAFVNSLKSFQDGLGHATSVLPTISCNNFETERITIPARPIVLGWNEWDLVDREPELKKLVRHFKQFGSFW
jgi:hypothetical protein